MSSPVILRTLLISVPAVFRMRRTAVIFFENREVIWPIRLRKPLSQLHPAAGEAGKTGDWRSQTPVIDHEKCTQKDTCLLCWLYCPDGVISSDFPLEIDLNSAKMRYLRGGMSTQSNRNGETNTKAEG